MIVATTPGKAGISETHIAAFMKEMQASDINFHSVLMLRGNGIFFEKYWEPFNAQKPHRMYSVTKSFVSIAIGCLVDEGKLSLDDRIVDYFPDKLPAQVHPFLRAQTIRDMLTMRTCFHSRNWFQPGVQDRTAFYFSQPVDKPAGTLFEYDSNGSYILGVLVERLSGRSLLDYLKEKVLNHIGGFEGAQILKTPDGTPWGDSALICTPRDLLRFARFVMNGGIWDGKRLLSEAYVRAATSRQADNNLEGNTAYNRYGYGYQIWRHVCGFSFNGLGGQFAICVPEKDFIFVCTADMQLSSDSQNALLFQAVKRHMIDPLDGDFPVHAAFDLDAPLKLSVARGQKHSAFREQISGNTYRLDENPMGIRWLRLELDDDAGCLIYENAQGEKQLPFAMKRNLFCKFPQAGYSDEYGNVHECNDFRYDCAVSAGWVDTQTLQMRVQIIDRYFGLLIVTFAFRDKAVVGLRMCKSAEDFLDEYDGWAMGTAECISK